MIAVLLLYIIGLFIYDKCFAKRNNEDTGRQSDIVRDLWVQIFRDLPIKWLNNPVTKRIIRKEN